MIGFCPLASGSKGNALYLGTKRTKILIDAGLSFKMLCERLSALHVDIASIDAVFITHEHIDHIRGLETLVSKRNIPVFANSDTAKAIYAQCKECPKFKIFSTNDPFPFEDLLVQPFSIQHDAVDPVAFVFHYEEIKIGVCADLGFASAQVVRHLKDADYLYVEANHQPSMVHACARPPFYKQRVLSKLGHLSNEACAELLNEVISLRLKHVYLAHLSSECNAPQLALEIVTSALKNKEYQGGVSIAYQDRVSEPVAF